MFCCVSLHAHLCSCALCTPSASPKYIAPPHPTVQVVKEQACMPASGGRAVEKQTAVRHLPSMLDKAAAKVQMAWRERAASRAQIVDEHKAAVKIQVCSTHAPQTLRTRSVHAPQHDPHTLRARSTHLLRTLYTRSATLSAPRALCICSRACPPERVPACTSARCSRRPFSAAAAAAPPSMAGDRAWQGSTHLR